MLLAHPDRCSLSGRFLLLLLLAQPFEKRGGWAVAMAAPEERRHWRGLLSHKPTAKPTARRLHSPTLEHHSHTAQAVPTQRSYNMQKTIQSKSSADLPNTLTSKYKNSRGPAVSHPPPLSAFALCSHTGLPTQLSSVWYLHIYAMINNIVINRHAAKTQAIADVFAVFRHWVPTNNMQRKTHWNTLKTLYSFFFFSFFCREPHT